MPSASSVLTQRRYTDSLLVVSSETGSPDSAGRAPASATSLNRDTRLFPCFTRPELYARFGCSVFGGSDVRCSDVRMGGWADGRWSGVGRAEHPDPEHPNPDPAGASA